MVRGASTLALVFLCACPRPGAVPPCETPPPYYIQITAGDRLNPDANGHPLPTQVQVLQLKGLARMEEADFTSIYRKAAETLGPDLLRTDEFTVDPGSNEGRWLERDPKATHAVVVGVVRQPTGNQWRSAQPLPPVPPEQCVPTAPGSRSGTPRPDDAQLLFRLDEYRVITPAAEERK